MYERIKQLPTVRQKYAAQLVQEGLISEADATARYDAAYERLSNAQQAFKGQAGSQQVAPETVERRGNPATRVDTAVPAATLVALNDALLTWPEGFAVNPKLARQLERRRATLTDDGGMDWAHAEELAFASLLVEGIPLRLTGQDTARGTFSQRHLVLHDVTTGAEYAPITRLPGALAPMELHNSPLSELAAIGFEYGYSVAAPETMILWEAQFGDFVNGAQVMIDQFMAAGLAKWGQTTRLTLLLPHGYEGQGPEHSSARLERFLQLAAENNMRIANCSTPAQYFHLLRRQAKRDRIRPLIVMTPKSLLRLPAAASHLKDLTDGEFQPVIDDAHASERAAGVTRVVLCSGKVYYDLLTAAAEMGEAAPAIVRVEQLYPFPDRELETVLGRYPKLAEMVWTQEEPRNMGAWHYAEPHLRRLLRDGVTLRYTGRPDRASPAEGYPSAHVAELACTVGVAWAPFWGPPGGPPGLRPNENAPRIDARAVSFFRSVQSSLARSGRSDACLASALSGSER
jgi:2-oxoglutarate dehydrogenase E1 component